MKRSKWINSIITVFLFSSMISFASEYTYIDFWLKNRSSNNLYIQIFYEGKRIGPNESKYGRILAGKKLQCGHMRVGAIINFYERKKDRYVPVYSIPIVKGMNNDTTVIGSEKGSVREFRN